MLLALACRASVTAERMLLGPVACVSALVVPPISWIYGVRVSGAHYVMWYEVTPQWSLLAGEASVMAVLLYFMVRWKTPPPFTITLLVAHYGFWAHYMWGAISVSRSVAVWLGTLTWAAAGVVWVLYAEQRTLESIARQ